MNAPLLTILLFTVFLTSCNSQKQSQNSSAPIQSLNVARAQLFTVKKCAVLVIASQQEPSKVARYYILQGTPAKEQSIPKSVLNGSNDFVSLQAGSKFWVLALSKTNRYENILTKSADAKILKGFGLSNYQEPGLDFDTFIADLKSGKYDSKFH